MATLPQVSTPDHMRMKVNWKQILLEVLRVLVAVLAGGSASMFM